MKLAPFTFSQKAKALPDSCVSLRGDLLCLSLVSVNMYFASVDAHTKHGQVSKSEVCKCTVN